MATSITVSTEIAASRDRVWECWNRPEHITRWCFASEDWHAPRAESDLQVGGRFVTEMAAKDGSAGFDFSGIYVEVVTLERVAYVIDGDGRKVSVAFAEKDGGTEVAETFETESINSLEQQRAGWQSILENFKKYVEVNGDGTL